MNGISKVYAAAAGFAGGIVNGMFGSGGGSVAVPVLELGGADARRSHAMSVAVMFFISMVSAFGSMIMGYAPFDTVKRLLPAGIAGAAAGSLLLRKVDNDILRRIFCALIIYSGGRMLLQ